MNFVGDGKVKSLAVALTKASVHYGRLCIPCYLSSDFITTLMSVLLETSLGDLVIDLETELCPNTCKNFLKLCKVYYYNLNAFFNGTLYSSFHV